MRRVDTPLSPQLFDSGLATIYQVVNTADKGNVPRGTPQKLFSVPFREQQISDARYYAALQADSKLSKVIRIPRVEGIQPSGDLVILSGDSRQYKVQKISRATWTSPESIDLTLELSKQTYKLKEVTDDDG